jgi:hypothetical protein
MNITNIDHRKIRLSAAIITVKRRICNLFRQKINGAIPEWETPVDRSGKMCYILCVTGEDEAIRVTQDAQRGSHLVEEICTPVLLRTPSELSGGNAGTGAPVTVPMSGGIFRNQGGTVEYFVSHP